MKRRLFNLAAGVSLVLCIVACVLWVRSYRLWEWGAYQTTSGRLYTLTSRLGALSFDVTDGWPSGQFKPFERHSDPVLVVGLPPSSEWNVLGFGVDRHAQMVGVGGWAGLSSGTSIIVPYWFIALVTILAALMISFPKLLRRCRLRCGSCPSCGYDLRATPDRCPECGTVTKQLRKPPHNPPMQRTGGEGIL